MDRVLWLLGIAMNSRTQIVVETTLHQFLAIDFHCLRVEDVPEVSIHHVSTINRG